MFHELLHSADDLISSDGAWWILGLNSILLIPLIFAAFFYPVEVFTGVGVTLVLLIAAVFAVRIHRARQT